MFHSRMRRHMVRAIRSHILASKRYPIISLLDSAANGSATAVLVNAVATTNAPADLSDVTIPPGATVKAIHLDFTITQGTGSAAEGACFWALMKNPGNLLASVDPQTVATATGPYVIARGCVGFNSNFSSGGEPYRVSGWFRLRRHQKFQQNDRLILMFRPVVIVGSLQGAAVFKYRL